MAQTEIFGKTSLGKDVTAYTITNGVISAEILDYGATIRSIYVPDKNGKIADVTVGYDTFAPYETSGGYEGKTVGRFANRIGGASFVLGGEKYQVEGNENGVTCLHGAGEFSFNFWNVESAGEDYITLSFSSPDGSHGFPGAVDAEVTFTVTDKNALKIEYKASASKKTVLSFTNHSYFNLGDEKNIRSHVLKLNAEHFTPSDAANIPTGEIRAVEGTPMDFRTAKPIGRDIDCDYEPLVLGKGYDHNYCLGEAGVMKEIAVVTEPESGRGMRVFTDMPGVQLYSGYFLDRAEGKNGRENGPEAGFCLETQFYPDSPNRPEFPSCVFGEGRDFSSVTVFEFFTEE